jgi:hypothetical protein
MLTKEGFMTDRRSDMVTNLEKGLEESISIVSGMNENDLDREGLHAFHGRGKLERFICWAYEHVRIHENDIREALQIKQGQGARLN